jgi:peptide deformylase
MSNPVIKIEGLEPMGGRPVPTNLTIKTEALAHKGSVQKLLPDNDPMLESVSEPFDFENPRFGHPISIAQSLIMSMRAYGGVGLSAVQIGLPVRVFCIGYENQNQVFFNPEIIAYSPETMKMKEGCISFPFCFVSVERSLGIRIRWQDETGAHKEEEFSGYTARIIQHEYDHMDGKTLPDKVSNLTWKLVKEKASTLYAKALKMERQKKQHASVG